jgi:hypothetical protein
MMSNRDKKEARKRWARNQEENRGKERKQKIMNVYIAVLRLMVIQSDARTHRSEVRTYQWHHRLLF